MALDHDGDAVRGAAASQAVRSSVDHRRDVVGALGDRLGPDAQQAGLQRRGDRRLALGVAAARPGRSGRGTSRSRPPRRRRRARRARPRAPPRGRPSGSRCGGCAGDLERVEPGADGDAAAAAAIGRSRAEMEQNASGSLRWARWPRISRGAEPSRRPSVSIPAISAIVVTRAARDPRAAPRTATARRARSARSRRAASVARRWVSVPRAPAMCGVRKTLGRS